MNRRSFVVPAFLLFALVRSASAAPPTAVIMAGSMSDPELISLSVAIAAAMPDDDFLMDSPRSEITARPLFERSKPGKLIPVGKFTRDNYVKAWGDVNT